MRILALLLVLAAALPASAQGLPKPPVSRPYMSSETRGEVVDADTRAPIEGAIVVARWEWLGWIPPRLHGGGYYQYGGDVVHMGEAVTGRDGRFAIPGWGPKVRGDGKLQEGTPALLAFKSGYEPGMGRAGGEPIALRKFTGTPKEYAAAIAKVQGGRMEGSRAGEGLAWEHPSENWKAMPRMILALHREKARLGADGAAIRGGNLLHGRAGRGELLDAQSGQPVWPGVITIEWTLRREDGSGATRRLVETKRSGVEGSSGTFYVSPWRLPQARRVPGWEIATDVAPMVRAYAPGYVRHPGVRWEEAGGTLRLRKLPGTREAIAGELRAWRRDVDQELASTADRAEALEGQRFLLVSLADECRKLTPDVRAGICFDPGSDVAAFAQKAMSAPSYVNDTIEGPQEVRIVAAPGRASGIQAQSAAVAPTGGIALPPGGRAPVSGFSIEPVQ